MTKVRVLSLILLIVLFSFPCWGQGLDWGDAPDPNYPTLMTSNGAVHIIMPPMFLGSLIDAELDGQPTATALGDDNNLSDDEDGVVFTNLVVAGKGVTVKVTASMPGFLDGWIDFNADGDWEDDWAYGDEHVFNARPLNPGVNTFSIFIPYCATAGTTYGRFRYSSVGGLSWDGPAPDGEVEDYRIVIQAPIENDKWNQPPDLDNTGMDVDMFPHMFPEINGLADDFMCTYSGPIIDIHFWGSFMDDEVPQLPTQIFEISIYSDIPAGQVTTWSMPGDLLWRMVFTPGQYLVTQVTDNNPEDYYFMLGPFWINDNHLNCYQYDFYIDELEAFIQDSGTIYWLGIRDMAAQGQHRFGWKTTHIDNGWNDNATYLCDPPSFWCPLSYPFGHEYQELPLNLAFALSTECDCLPGECNDDGAYNIFDITYLISFLYMSGPIPYPYPLCSGDVNCDCTINIFDITGLIAYLYMCSPPPCTCLEWKSACGPLRLK